MGLTGFTQFFKKKKTPTDSKAEDGAFAAANVDKFEAGDTGAMFVDIIFLLSKGKLEYGTGTPFYHDVQDAEQEADESAAASDKLPSMKKPTHPMTLPRLSDYLVKFIERVLKTRKSLTTLVFGADNHTMVPAIKLNTWHARTFSKRSGESFPNTPKSNFCMSEETLACNLVNLLRRGRPDAFKEAILGLSFCHKGPLFYDMLNDRNMRPLFLSLLFEHAIARIRPELYANHTIYFMHPVFDFDKMCTDPAKCFLPNLLARGQLKHSDDGLHIGEADLQMVWLMDKIAEKKATLEVLSDDSDVIIILLLQRLRRGYAGEVVVWANEALCISMHKMHALLEKYPPIGNLLAVSDEAKRPDWCMEFFVIFSLLLFKNDFYDNASNIGSTFDNFKLLLKMLGEHGYRYNRQLTTMHEGNLRFNHMDITKLAHLMILIHHNHKKVRLNATIPDKGVEALVKKIATSGQYFADTNGLFLDQGDAAWRKYVDSTKFKKFPDHPVKAIAPRTAVDDDLTIPEDIVNPEQMVSLVQHMLDVEDEVSGRKRVFVMSSNDPVMRTSVRENATGDCESAIEELRGAARSMQETATQAFNDAHLYTTMNSVATTVYFPGDLTYVSLFQRAARLEWLVSYWLFGTSKVFSKQQPLAADSEKATHAFDDKKATITPTAQLVQLMRLAGYRPVIDGSRHVCALMRDPAYAAIKEMQQRGGATVMTVINPLQSSDVRCNFKPMLLNTGLFLLTRPLPHYSGADPVTQHIAECINGLRLTHMDSMVSFSRLHHAWLQEFAEIMDKSAHTASGAVLYPDEQLVYRLLLARFLMGHDQSGDDGDVILQKMPLLKHAHTAVVPVYRITELDAFVDVLRSPCQLGEYAYPHAASNILLMNQWSLERMALFTNESMAGALVSPEKDEDYAVPNYYIAHALRQPSHPLVTARELLATGKAGVYNIGEWRGMVQMKGEDEQYAHLTRLSASLDVCAYGMPLLRYRACSEQTWLNRMVQFMDIFKPVMELAFETFMEWKINQSIYLKSVLAVRPTTPITTAHVRRFMDVYAPGVASYKPPLPVKEIQLSEVALDQFRASWPVALLYSLNIDIVDDTEVRDAVNQIIVDNHETLYMLDRVFASVMNLLVKTELVEDELVFTMLFLGWEEDLLEHYLLFAFCRMQEFKEENDKGMDRFFNTTISITFNGVPRVCKFVFLAGMSRQMML